jgi:signal transduction histidine kinase
MFKLFAELIAFHLDAMERVATSEGELAAERKAADLREKFIAVLGHDLRNPLASIAGGVRLLRKKADPEATTWLNHMQASVVRMSRLIDNVMDFTRARLGGGITLNLADEPLAPLVEQIVSEFEGVHPDRKITTVVTVPRPVRVDAVRLGQLLSNLLGNAVAYGNPAEPIEVAAEPSGQGFTISVSNKGNPISEAIKPLLFTAFQRGDVLPSQKGLGLGLYIAKEIASAHGGDLSVTSTPEGTKFTADFPAASMV